MHATLSTTQTQPSGPHAARNRLLACYEIDAKRHFLIEKPLVIVKKKGRQ